MVIGVHVANDSAEETVTNSNERATDELQESRITDDDSVRSDGEAIELASSTSVKDLAAETSQGQEAG